MAVKAMKGRLMDRCCASDDVARKRCDMVIRYAIILVCITAVVTCVKSTSASGARGRAGSVER